MERFPVSLPLIFTVALLHTLIPSHWLCFVVVGRVQRWSIGRTLAVAGAAGVLHAVTTIALGVAIILFGRRVMDEEAMERLSAVVLICLGLIYLFSHVFHVGHRHSHDEAMTGKAATAALLFSLVLSPCSAAIPFLVAVSCSTSTLWPSASWKPMPSSPCRR